MPEPAATMMFSAVLVVCAPDRADETRVALADLPWAEVHHADSVGRLVVTLEAADVDESMERLQALQALPTVVMAEMAEYVVEDV